MGMADVELVLRATGVVDGRDDGVDLRQTADSKSQSGASEVFQRQFERLGVERVRGGRGWPDGGTKDPGDQAAAATTAMLLLLLLVMVVVVMMLGVLHFLYRVPDEFRHRAVSGDAQFVVGESTHVTEIEKEGRRNKERSN